MSPNEQKPSQTAFFSALRRAIANKIYQISPYAPDDLAEVFLPPYYRFFLKFKSIQRNTWEKLNIAFPGINEYIIARTAYFDKHFKSALERQIPQIVLLGAGYDSRAFRFADLNQKTKVFELDSLPTQNRKKACLKKAKLDIPQQISFVPIDFNHELLEDVLSKSGFNINQETLFLWEGVSYYLDPESAEETLNFFSNSTHIASIFVFDYTISITEEDIHDSYGSKAFLQSMAQHHADEAFMFSIPHGEIDRFLENRNLQCKEYLDNEDIEKRFLIDSTDQLIGRVAGHFRFVTVGHKNG